MFYFLQYTRVPVVKKTLHILKSVQKIYVYIVSNVLILPG